MSAFIVGPDHIDLLVTAAIDWDVRVTVPDESAPFGYRALDLTPTELGRLLLRENLASVDYRYQGRLEESEFKAPEVYEFRRVPHGALHPAWVLKALHCLEYQSCEHDGWESSTAFRVVRALEAAAARRVPGYEDGPGWEFTRSGYDRWVEDKRSQLGMA